LDEKTKKRLLGKMTKPEEFIIPEKCPKCGGKKFDKRQDGDLVCVNCGEIVGRWSDFFDLGQADME
jgi:uncharacterized Zn finger protein (UPF0148 family)